MSIVTKAWELLVVGSSNSVWERKLKNTKATLKVWDKLTQKNPISERKEALEKLEKIQMEMEDSKITPTLLAKKKQAQLNSF